eukprot:5686756-Alexandrium_andersonii.AAC.1
MCARRAEQEYDPQSGCYMYPRSMVLVVEDCSNTIYVAENQMYTADGKTKIMKELMQSHWPMSIGD